MTDFADHLPEEVEIGAVKRTEWGTEIVTTDGGFEVRNNRWSRPKLSFEVSFPHSRRDDDIYQAVIALYEKCEGMTHSFLMTDWTDESGGTVVRVRFDSPLEIMSPASHLDHIETLILREVFV